MCHIEENDVDFLCVNKTSVKLKKMIWIFSALTGLLGSGFSTGVSSEEISIGYMGLTSGYNTVLYVSRIGASVAIAVDSINSNRSTILQNNTLTYSMADTKCDRKVALNSFVSMVQNDGIRVLIGPPCGAEIEAVGLLASQWNVAMVNYVSLTPALEDKQTFDTLTILGGNHKQSGQCIRAVLAYLEVKNICLYTTLPPTKGHLLFIEQGLLQDTGAENITVLEAFEFDFFSQDPSKHHEQLRQIKRQCRGKTLDSLSTKRYLKLKQ